MTSMKINPIIKESNKEEKNYQLNMEILTSLKTLPGKVVNLQSEKIIFNNEDNHKKVFFPEEKFSTSSSVFFCDPFSTNTEKNQKKSFTTNSVFKPIIYNPIKKTSMNLYNFGSMMSFSDFLAPNPTSFNPLKITNSSYSKNSFCPIMNQDSTLINPINIIHNYTINPITTLNPINNINSMTSIFPNYSQIPLFNEQALNKSLSQTKNNIFLNKKRNSDNDMNLNFNIKENENKEKELNDIKKNNVVKSNTAKQKSTFFLVKQPKNQIIENPQKKHLFTVIPKSNYIYRKRKPRKTKFFNGIKAGINCRHKGCESVFKTKKQLVFHHYKMSPECHNDTINILKMIYFTKIILLKDIEGRENLFGKYSELYKITMNNISLDEHIETLVGLNFEDILKVE